ncbi:MAG: hypothetical protein JST92_07965, partial [Deltaproteobacteria bacterium]|nr:hypothetical protein [Deltaproteobacteria bacterium]
ANTVFMQDSVCGSLLYSRSGGSWSVEQLKSSSGVVYLNSDAGADVPAFVDAPTASVLYRRLNGPPSPTSPTDPSLVIDKLTKTGSFWTRTILYQKPVAAFTPGPFSGSGALHNLASWARGSQAGEFLIADPNESVLGLVRFE